MIFYKKVYNIKVMISDLRFFIPAKLKRQMYRFSHGHKTFLSCPLNPLQTCSTLKCSFSFPFASFFLHVFPPPPLCLLFSLSHPPSKTLNGMGCTEQGKSN